MQIIQDLLEKCQEIYIGHLARLGVISHVAELASSILETETVQEEPEVKGKEGETEKKVTSIAFAKNYAAKFFLTNLEVFGVFDIASESIDTPLKISKQKFIL